MTRRLTAVLSALEALLIVGIGIAVPLSVLTIMWAAQFGFQVDWVVFWRAAVLIWLVGHGVDVTFQLDEQTALALGVTGVADPFVVSLALSGFALCTAFAGVALGRRLRSESHRVLGELVALGTVVVLSGLAMLSAVHPAALPSRWQALLFPALVLGLGLAIGSIGATNPARVRLRRLLAEGPQPWLAAGGAALRAGLGAVATVVAAAALVTAAALVLGYGQVIALYESVQAGVLGGVALTVAQLALLPTLVLWAAAWLVGPGFAVGAGSSVSPIATSLGPLPAVPVLGALPTEPSSLGFVTLLVPVLAAFIAGLAVRPRLVAALEGRPAGLWAVGTGALAAVVAGLAMGFLAFVAAGAAGPGRLAVVGPDPVAVGLWMLIETLIGASLGLLAGGVRAARPLASARTR
ncbi:cell division protein PerM [Microcella sp.]|uniref:cell division protein PerM n=1 Tax=Microcella sp. TaxID=1913979 RepID=UPI003F6EC48F